MKEFIEFIKKLWANKRTRALAMLILYFIFFVFVFLVIGNSTPTKPISNESKTELKDKKISKIEFLGTENFIFENNNIIYNESIYSVNELPIELSNYDLSIYTIDNIDKLIKASVLESTNYVENSNTYLLSVKEFESIIYNNHIDSNLNIRIKINKEKLDYVYIDFKEYYGYEVNIDLRS